MLGTAVEQLVTRGERVVTYSCSVVVRRRKLVTHAKRERPDMMLLHTNDRAARRLEFGAFAGLALSGLALIGMAASDAVRFASHDDGIAQALSLDLRGIAQVHSVPATNQQGTNFSLTHASAKAAESCCAM